MKGLDALIRLLLLIVVAWLVVPILERWLDVTMPIVGCLLLLVVVIRVLLGKGVKP